MGCRNQWADDSHLIMNLFIEVPWTWPEFMTHADQTFAIIRTTGKPCATTVDVSKIGAMPTGNVLRYLTEIEKLMPESIFASVLIGAPPLVSVFMDVIMRMRPHAQQIALFAKTHEEAYEKIGERYAKLNTRSEKSG